MTNRTIKIILFNILLLGIIFVIIEGASSIITAFMDNFMSKGRMPLYTDPYSGKPVYLMKLHNVYLQERYAPDSLAYIYYDNTDWKSPMGLYTDSYGFVHNGDPRRDLKRKLDNGGERVFIFGGSSVMGASSTTSNKYTIAAFMEYFLNSGKASDNQVVNAAVEGYETFRDFIYAAHLMDQFDIDTLVFLNGRNDWYRLTATEKFYINYYPEEEKVVSAGGVSRPFLSSLSVKNLISYLKARPRAQLQHPVLSIVYDNKKFPRDTFIINPDDLFKNGAYRKKLTYRPDALRNYIDNLRSIAGLCMGHKKRCVIALQPALGYGAHKPTPDEEAYLRRIPFESWVETQKEFYDNAVKEFKKLSVEFKNTSIEFIDLTGIFDDIDERVFLDSIHYIDAGNAIIGAALASQIIYGDWRMYRKFKRQANAI